MLTFLEDIKDKRRTAIKQRLDRSFFRHGNSQSGGGNVACDTQEANMAPRNSPNSQVSIQREPPNGPAPAIADRFGIGYGAELRQPMAMVIVGG